MTSFVCFANKRCHILIILALFARKNTDKKLRF